MKPHMVLVTLKKILEICRDVLADIYMLTNLNLFHFLQDSLSGKLFADEDESALKSRFENFLPSGEFSFTSIEF